MLSSSIEVCSKTQGRSTIKLTTVKPGLESSDPKTNQEPRSNQWSFHCGRSQGAAQFRRDCGALTALVAPYTRRPGAHFRELLDSATLLCLPAGQVCACAALGLFSAKQHSEPVLLRLAMH